MCTKYREIFAALAAPFAATEIKTKPVGGRQLRFVTARTIMNRLDAVLGPENWWDDFTPLEKSVICRLTIRLPDGTTITKADAGGYAGMADAGDDEKSGFSDAFKRVAVKFGTGRYLYNDGVANLVESSPATTAVAEIPTAPPPVVKAGSEDAQGRGGKMVYGASGAKPRPGTPKTGEDLYFYACSNSIDPNLVNWISNTHTPMGFPEKIMQWSPDEVRRALPSVKEHLETVKQARERMKRTA